MRNTKLKITSMALLMLLLTGLTGYAQDHEMQQKRREGKSGMHKEYKMREHGSQIPNLSDEQKEKMKVAKLNLHREMLPLKNALGEKKARLQTLTSTVGSSEKEINKVIDEIGVLNTNMMKAKISNQMEINKFLTEEQRLFMDRHHSMKNSGHKMRH